MKRLALVTYAALLGGLALPLIRDVAAQPTNVQGRYLLDAQASDDVHKAIDGVVAEMGGLRGPFARLRLRSLNQPSQRIDFAATESDVSVTTDDGEVIRTRADGTPVPWKKADGEEFTIRTRWDGRALKRTFEAPDGERANTYEFSPDGATLTMRVVLTSPQLPGPLAYTLVYRRAP
jgi:hypothetical protein